MKARAKGSTRKVSLHSLLSTASLHSASLGTLDVRELVMAFIQFFSTGVLLCGSQDIWRVRDAVIAVGDTLFHF